MPNPGVVLSNEVLTPEHVAALAGREDFRTEAFASSEVFISEHHVHRCPLPALLWNCAMAADTPASSWLPKNASFSLKRWPDFGRLAHRPWHLRLTALLVREPFSAQQLSVLI